MVGATTERTPLVSVVLPTHNRHDLVRRALDSALMQHYPNKEVLVIDDASDPPVQLNDEAIRLIRLETIQGPAMARNVGVSASRGSLIAFLDDDDEWLPEKLSKQIALLSQSDDRVAGVDCGHESFLDGEPFLASTPKADRDLRSQLLKEPTIGPPTILLRKEVFEQVGGFNPELARYEDWDLWLRITDIYEIIPLSEVLVRIHLSQGVPARLHLHWYREMLRRIQPRISERPTGERVRLRWWHFRRLAIRVSGVFVSRLIGPRGWHALRRWKQSLNRGIS